MAELPDQQSNKKPVKIEKETLTVSQKLALAREEMERDSATSKVDLVWGLRFAFSALFCVGAIIIIYDGIADGTYNGLGIGILMLLYFLAEIVSIIGYFRRKPRCVIPLHIFAGIAILNFPIGTILSSIHYVYIGKVKFDQ